MSAVLDRIAAKCEQAKSRIDSRGNDDDGQQYRQPDYVPPHKWRARGKARAPHENSYAG